MATGCSLKGSLAAIPFARSLCFELEMGKYMPKGARGAILDR